MPKPYDPLRFQLYQDFDFANATDAQKEVLARETAHCSRGFQASFALWKSQPAPAIQLDRSDETRSKATPHHAVW